MKLIAYVFLTIAMAATSIQARGWRGIIPLRSSRAEVERLLGPPTEEISKNTVSYRTGTESATIRYATGLPCGIGEKYSQWKVLRNTVESITVTLIPAIPLSKFGIDESKYKERRDPHLPQNVYYVSDSEGEIVRVAAGEVQDINYTGALADETLACFPRQRSSVDCDAMSPPHFDFYGNIRFSDEQARLDNFVITLTDEKDRIGYIIAYAGPRARIREAQTRAEQAKNYLVTVRHFPASRLIAIDGGYRDEPEVDLYIVAKGVCPPRPIPAVDPRDVKIIGASTSRRSKRRAH